MSENEQKLLELLKKRSIKHGQFQLASGGSSKYFIDGKMTEVYSEGAFLIGEVLYERTKDLAIDAIGGLQVGAVPLTTAAVISYHLREQTMEGFWVREELKTHGTRKWIEGGLKAGARVVVVDDVCTKGGSALKAIQAVREIGCEVVLVLAMVDRLEGAEELFRRNGIENYQALFTIRDLGLAPMHVTQLKPLLVKGAFTPGSVTAISVICDDWYRVETSLVAFVFRSVFRDLIAHGWDDPQGIPTPLFQQFVADVLPRLNDVLTVLPGDPTNSLKILVFAYSSFI